MRLKSLYTDLFQEARVIPAQFMTAKFSKERLLAPSICAHTYIVHIASGYAYLYICVHVGPRELGQNYVPVYSDVP